MVQIKSSFSRMIKVPEELTLCFQGKCKDANVSAIFSAKICIIINQYWNKKYCIFTYRIFCKKESRCIGRHISKQPIKPLHSSWP